MSVVFTPQSYQSHDPLFALSGKFFTNRDGQLQLQSIGGPTFIMAYRFGLALILIGLISLIVFAVTYMNQEGDVRTLLLGASLCALGLIIRRRIARCNKIETSRFRMFRRFNERINEEED
jgi:hypothetical protein